MSYHKYEGKKIVILLKFVCHSETSTIDYVHGVCGYKQSVGKFVFLLTQVQCVCALSNL